MEGTTTFVLQQCLDRLKSGDPEAREELLRHSQERVRLLTAKMLRAFPGVRRWEDTDNVCQNVLLRLDRMLKQMTVSTARDYLGLAAKQIRRELIDLWRHYFGPQGMGANYATPPPPSAGGEGGPVPLEGPADSSNDPGQLAGWGEIHRQIGLLPDAEREIFDLHWYQGLTHAEAAELLGVSVSMVKRRWQSARLRLMEALGGELPF